MRKLLISEIETSPRKIEELRRASVVFVSMEIDRYNPQSDTIILLIIIRGRAVDLLKYVKH